MILICALFPILGAVFLFLFLRIRIRKAEASSLILKTLTSVCFLGLAFYGAARCASAGEGTGYAFLITAGLFFGLLGDIWLDLKYNCLAGRNAEVESRQDATAEIWRNAAAKSRQDAAAQSRQDAAAQSRQDAAAQSDLYTYAGFVSFAIGHIFFLTALLKYYRNGAGAAGIILPFVIAAAAGIAVGMGGKLLKVDYGKFKGITMAYGALLISSALVSLSLTISGGFKTPATILFFIGAVLFLASDLILSGTYFGTGKDRPADIISNHIFYYAAQFLIAASVFVQ